MAHNSFWSRFVKKISNIQCFAAFSSIVVCIQGLYLGYIIGVLSTIEQRFGFASSRSGSLLSIYDVGHALSVLLVGHFGLYLHQPRWIASGCWLSGLACLGLSMSHFIFPNKALSSPPCQNHTIIDNLTVISDNSCPTVENSSNGIGPYLVMALFQILAGVGSCAFTTLTYVFIDNNCTRKQSPFLLGVMTAMWGYGPAFGFALSAVTSTIYADVGGPPPDLDSSSPEWIGAWWLGFLICAFLYFVFGIPFLVYPRSLKKVKTIENGTTVEKEPLNAALGNMETQFTIKWFIKKLLVLPVEVVSIMRNKVLTPVIISWILGSFVIGGFYTFMPKYLESHFQETTSMANIYAALIAIFGSATATGIGGKVMSWLTLGPRTGLLLVAITWFHAFFTDLILMMINCQNQNIIGMIDDGSKLSQCSSEFSCDSTYSPVCVPDGQITFFSACHAGCSPFNSSTQMYADCLCANGTGALEGACAVVCANNRNLYVVAAFLSSFVSSFFQMATFTAIIWSVPVERKAISVALAGFLCSLLGFMPSQVVFGRLVDSTCTLWSPSGYCLLYDNKNLRVRFHGGATIFQAGAAVAVLAAWWFSRTFTFYSHEDEPIAEESAEDEFRSRSNTVAAMERETDI